jgi:type II secretory pathway component PulF
MIRFSYKAVSKEGKPAGGIIEAVDRKNAIALLAQRGQFALELEETSASASAAATIQESRPLFVSDRIASRDILMVTEQITTALRAGLPVLQALEIVAQHRINRGTSNLGRIAQPSGPGRSFRKPRLNTRCFFQP